MFQLCFTRNAISQKPPSPVTMASYAALVMKVALVPYLASARIRSLTATTIIEFLVHSRAPHLSPSIMNLVTSAIASTATTMSSVAVRNAAQLPPVPASMTTGFASTIMCFVQKHALKQDRPLVIVAALTHILFAPTTRVLVMDFQTTRMPSSAIATIPENSSALIYAVTLPSNVQKFLHIFLFRAPLRTRPRCASMVRHVARAKKAVDFLA